APVRRKANLEVLPWRRRRQGGRRPRGTGGQARWKRQKEATRKKGSAPARTKRRATPRRAAQATAEAAAGRSICTAGSPRLCATRRSGGEPSTSNPRRGRRKRCPE